MSSAATVESRSRVRLFEWFTVALIAILVVALRLGTDLGRDLWEDEVLSAVHSQHPAWQLPVEVARDDVHPFLYFFQLHLWSLVGDSDTWLRLNSVFWNLAAIGSLLVVGRRLYGSRVGWIAAGLFALSAPCVWLALDVRPYSFMSCVYIWAFFSVEMWCRDSGRRVGYKIASFLLCVALIYSHGLGFFMVFMLGLYALSRMVVLGLDRRQFVTWILLFGLCALTAGPPLVEVLLRDANLVPSLGVVGDLALWVPRFLLPRGNEPLALVASSAVFVGVVLVGGAVRATRPMALIFVALPLAIAVVLNVFGFQLFKLAVFTMFIVPPFTLVLARLLGRLPPRQAWGGAAAAGVLFLVFTALFFGDRVPATGFRAATAMIEAQARPGDIVYVPQQSMFWGMARYMDPDRRAWQLQIAPGLTPEWRRMYDRLGPWFVSTFKLEPQGQILQPPSGPPLLVGNDSLQQAAQAHRVWLVTYSLRRVDLPRWFPAATIGTLRPSTTATTGFLNITLYE